MSNLHPERLVRAMQGKVEVDVARRVIKRAVFVTRGIASDGGIVDPAGINTDFFQQNPQVLAAHGRDSSSRSPVIGRSLSLRATANGMESETQFADTELAREYAYLYGVNDAGEVYMRGWSFGWTSQDVEIWPLERARSWLGADYDDNLVPGHVKRRGEVWVCRRCVMNEYSAVASPADRMALSRAMGDGIRTAGSMLADMDLDEAMGLIRDLQNTHTEQEKRIAKLEQDIKALRGDDAAAATRGDSAAVLKELREWHSELSARQRNNW